MNTATYNKAEVDATLAPIAEAFDQTHLIIHNYTEVIDALPEEAHAGMYERLGRIVADAHRKVGE